MLSPALITVVNTPERIDQAPKLVMHNPYGEATPMSATSFTASNGDQLDVLHTLGGVVIAAHDHPNAAPVGATLDPRDDAAFMATILKARGIEPFAGADFGRALVRGVTYNQALAYALRFLEHAEAIETSRREEEEKRTQKLKRRQEHERNRQRNALVSELMEITRNAAPGELIHKPIAAFIEDNYTRTTGQPNLEDEGGDAEVFIKADLDGFQAALIDNAEKLAAQTATPRFQKPPVLPYDVVESCPVARCDRYNGHELPHSSYETGDFKTIGEDNNEPLHNTKWYTPGGGSVVHDGEYWCHWSADGIRLGRFTWNNLPSAVYPLTEAV